MKDVRRVFNLSMTAADVAGYCENVDEETIKKIRFYCQMPTATEKGSQIDWLGNWDQKYGGK